MTCHMFLSCTVSQYMMYEIFMASVLFCNIVVLVMNLYKHIRQFIAYLLPRKLSIGIDTMSCNIPAQIDNIIVVVRENIYKTTEILYKCIDSDQSVKHLVSNHKSFTSSAIDDKLKLYADKLKMDIENYVESSHLTTPRVYITENINNFIIDLVDEINTELRNNYNPNNLFIVMKTCGNGCEFALVQRGIQKSY